MNKSTLGFVAILSLCAALPAAQDHTTSVIAGNPQWEKVKSLIGEWEGYGMESGQKTPIRISIRMTADGSAVMHWMGAGTPHEMITMFHMDKSDLLATHYCAAHNQRGRIRIQGRHEHPPRRWLYAAARHHVRGCQPPQRNLGLRQSGKDRGRHLQHDSGENGKVILTRQVFNITQDPGYDRALVSPGA